MPRNDTRRATLVPVLLLGSIGKRVRCRAEGLLDTDRRQREGEPECGATPVRPIHPDPASMALHDRLRDGQTDARPTIGTRPRRVDPIEALEHEGLMLRRDARPG